MDSTIEVRDLVKEFGSFRALDGFNLDVKEGSVHGFLGPNGSGKSTTIRILLGVLHATSGSARILNHNPRTSPSILRRVGYVPGDVALWPNLTGLEVLRALESLRGRKVDQQREEELIEVFQLDPNKKTREYSTGNRRKVSLISALSIDADLLILDEPTAGLDPLMEYEFIQQVQHEQHRGATVLLSSHIMSEVEKLCDTVTVIKQGRAIESGPIAELRHLSSQEISAFIPSMTPPLRSLSKATYDGEQFHITARREQVPDILQHILNAGGVDIICSPASLEAIFLSHYQASGEGPE